MNLEEDKIKDLFSSKLNNFEADVPDSIWNDIDKSLSQNQITKGTASKSRTIQLRQILTAACILAAICTGVFIYFSSNNNIITPPVAEEKNNIYDSAETDKQETISQGINDHKVLANNDKSGNKDRKSQPLITQYIPVNSATAEDPKQMSDNIIPQIENKLPQEINKNNSDKKTDSNRDKSSYAANERGSINASEKPLPVNITSSSNSFSFGVNTNAGLLSSNMSQNNGAIGFASKKETIILKDNLFASSEMVYGSNDYDLDHDLPISFGIMVSKSITPQLSVETGITYTFLSSKIVSKGEYSTYEKQKFHYIGVPLMVNYTFYKLGNAKFYVAAGGEVQKDIQGRYTGSLNKISTAPAMTMNELQELNIKNKASDISQDYPQFSAKINIGASYPIYGKLKVYGSIGGAHYFKNDNLYRTIYSDKRNQIDLNIGLKLDF